jgi:hypothetical protein
VAWRRSCRNISNSDFSLPFWSLLCKDYLSDLYWHEKKHNLYADDTPANVFIPDLSNLHDILMG